MADKPTLYRKRLIPNECIRLDQDKVLLRNEHLLVTRWHTIRPKKELDHGISCFLLDKGWKISRFLNREDQLICWYCDIIDWTHDPNTDTYVFTDLLADVLIYPSASLSGILLDIKSAVYKLLCTQLLFYTSNSIFLPVASYSTSSTPAARNIRLEARTDAVPAYLSLP